MRNIYSELPAYVSTNPSVPIALGLSPIGELQGCAAADASIGASATLNSGDGEVPAFSIGVTVVETPPLDLTVQVPVTSNPGTVLVDSGRTIVALNQTINVEAVPKSGSMELPMSAGVAWANSMGSAQVQTQGGTNIATGQVRFTSAGQQQAEVTISNAGAHLTFRADVFVKGPDEPLASATITNKKVGTPYHACTSDPDEPGKLSSCSSVICVKATASRAKWQQAKPEAAERTVTAYRGEGVATDVAVVVDPLAPSVVAFCGNADLGVTFRVVAREGQASDELTLIAPPAEDW
ncbi:MAG: hypothetical protein U1E65_21640 [Myxococcota bacterium]